MDILWHCWRRSLYFLWVDIDAICALESKHRPFQRSIQLCPKSRLGKSSNDVFGYFFFDNSLTLRDLLHEPKLLQDHCGAGTWTPVSFADRATAWGRFVCVCECLCLRVSFLPWHRKKFIFYYGEQYLCHCILPVSSNVWVVCHVNMLQI